MPSKNDCWKKRTQNERILIVCVVILLIICISLFTKWIAKTHEEKEWTTPNYIRSALHINDYVNTSIDPCDNFHDFVCSKFLKTSAVLKQPHALYYLNHLTKSQLKAILLQIEKDTSKPSKSLVLQRQFYKSCVNEFKMPFDEELWTTSFMQLLDLVGGWPVVKGSSWNDQQFDWQRIMIRAKEAGLPYDFFLQIIVSRNGEENDTISLLISPPTKDPSDEIEWQASSMEEMSNIAHFLGAPQEFARSELEKTRHFANQLINITDKAWKTVNEGNEFKNVKHLNQAVANMAWPDFLKNLTGNYNFTPETLIINSTDLNMYLKDLYILLVTTPKRIQANYIIWFMISRNINYLSKPIRDQSLTMHSIRNIPRDEVCFKHALNLFKYVLEAEYIRKHTPIKKQENIGEMITNIKTEIAKSLKKTKWLDKNTTEEALNSIKDLANRTGWSQEIYDSEKFDKFFGYDKIKFSSNNLITMVSEVRKGLSKAMFGKLFKNATVLEDQFNFSPNLDINAYYELQENAIVLPASILQGFVYNDDRPQYMNYGALGSILGHELTHSVVFSQKSNETDDEFNWYSSEASQSYHKAVQCVVEEYEAFSKNNIVSPSKTAYSTLEENIADFNGIEIAYRAYRQWVKKHGMEHFLPGIAYTPNQIFWIMSGTFLCSNPDLIPKTKDPKHSPSTFRIYGSFRNSHCFAKDFDCPLGTRMNPAKKCKVFA